MNSGGKSCRNVWWAKAETGIVLRAQISLPEHKQYSGFNPSCRDVHPELHSEHCEFNCSQWTCASTFFFFFYSGWCNDTEILKNISCQRESRSPSRMSHSDCGPVTFCGALKGQLFTYQGKYISIFSLRQVCALMTLKSCSLIPFLASCLRNISTRIGWNAVTWDRSLMAGSAFHQMK